MRKRIMIMGLLCVVSMYSLTACLQNQDQGRQVIKKPDKEIVVLDKVNESDKGKTALEKIDRIDDMRALDWIDEETLLIMKENRNMPSVQGESGMVFPKNFYMYGLEDKEAKLIRESKVNMSNGIVSPDKRYIFYKEGMEENLTGFILDLSTGEKRQITELDSVSSYEGRWLDNDTVVLSSFSEGDIYEADTNGQVRKLAKAPERLIANTIKLGDNVWYTKMDGKLYVQKVGSDERKLLLENVIWLIPSPDMTQLAMVKRVAETRMQLVLTDLEGKEIRSFSEGTQVYGVNWSPDGTKLAYNLVSLDGGQSGLFIADTGTGEVTQLAVDMQYAADPIRWSPSGKKLVTSSPVVEDNGYRFMTYVVYIK